MASIIDDIITNTAVTAQTGNTETQDTALPAGAAGGRNCGGDYCYRY
jgi:hypothetical protein